MHDFLSRFGIILLDTLVPIGVGFFLHKAGWINKQGIDWVIKFNVRVMFTILSVLAFWKLKLTWELMMLPVGGIVMMIIPLFLMTYVTKKNNDPLERGALITAGMLGNIGTLGGVIAFLILGAAGFSYVQILATIANVVLILINFPLCQKYREEAEAMKVAENERLGKPCSGPRASVPVRRKLNFVSLFFTWNQVALVGMLAGIALSEMNVSQPQWLTSLFAPMVHISAWIAFLPVGLLLNFKAAAREMKKTLVILPVKFVLLPLVMWVFCSLTMSDPTMIATLVICSACPTAINAVLASALYGLKTDIAISSLMTSTVVFALVVCPVLVMLYL